jgi:hypothetical protein
MSSFNVFALWPEFIWYVRRLVENVFSQQQVTWTVRIRLTTRPARQRRILTRKMWSARNRSSGVQVAAGDFTYSYPVWVMSSPCLLGFDFTLLCPKRCLRQYMRSLPPPYPAHFSLFSWFLKNKGRFVLSPCFLYFSSMRHGPQKVRRLQQVFVAAGT